MVFEKTAEEFASLFWKNSVSLNLRMYFCMLDLSSILLRLDVDVNFRPRKRI